MDKQYWNTFYKNALLTLEPSPFAVKMAEECIDKKNGCLLELGCGNGRDSLYFCSLGLHVTAIDASEYAINTLKQKQVNSSIEFLQGDFVELQDFDLPLYQYVYSRFTLHSITEDQQHTLFQNIWNVLEPDGMFMVEARSVQDDICGKGKQVGKNCYIYDDHFRRFLELEEQINFAKKYGFEVVFADQQRDWAMYGNENPIVIRLVLRKETKVIGK